MRSTIMLVLVSAVLGCGPDMVEPLTNLVRCEPGPQLTIQREPCPIVVEGSGGPSSAELLTIEADIIARLGLELEPMWSRALSYDWPSVGGSRQAVSEWGVDVWLDETLERSSAAISAATTSSATNATCTGASTRCLHQRVGRRVLATWTSTSPRSSLATRYHE